MPVQFQYEEKGSVIDSTVTFTCPNILWIRGNFATKALTRISRELGWLGTALQKATVTAYSFEPFSKSVKAFNRLVRSTRQAQGGVEMDRFALLVEYDTTPHWPPHGPNSRLARWATRHGFSVHSIAAIIAFRGTKGKGAIRAAFAQLLPQFHTRVTASLDKLFTTDQ